MPESRGSSLIQPPPQATTSPTSPMAEPSTDKPDLPSTDNTTPPTPTSSTTVVPTSPQPPLSPEIHGNIQHESSSPGLLEVLGKGHRTKKPSILLKEFVTNTAQTTTLPSLAQARSDHDLSASGPGKNPYPIANYLSTSIFNEKHQAFLATITTESVPKTYSKAVRDPRFNGAMKTKIVALEHQHT